MKKTELNEHGTEPIETIVATAPETPGQTDG
jgi:hypothetical protein